MSATVRRLEAFKAETGIYATKPAIQRSLGNRLSQAHAENARHTETLERVDLVRRTLRVMLRADRVGDAEKAVVRLVLKELTKAIHGKRGE